MLEAALEKLNSDMDAQLNSVVKAATRAGSVRPRSNSTGGPRSNSTRNTTSAPTIPTEAAGTGPPVRRMPTITTQDVDVHHLNGGSAVVVATTHAHVHGTPSPGTTPPAHPQRTPPTGRHALPTTSTNTMPTRPKTSAAAAALHQQRCRQDQLAPPASYPGRTPGRTRRQLDLQYVLLGRYMNWDLLSLPLK